MLMPASRKRSCSSFSICSRGLGGRLVRETLDYVRSQGMHVLSTCPFVTDWINRHPDYQDLVYRPETRAS